MSKKLLCTVVSIILIPAFCFAQENDTAVLPDGIEFGVGVTNIYQHNARGGLSTHRRAGRFSGSYDLEMSIDTEKIFGWENGAFFMLAEGSWSKSGGINDPSVGSIFGVNADGAPRRSMDITELWYEHSFWDNTLLIRIGKIDLTGGFECGGRAASFDGSMFANDETSQFLNGAFVNNPTIPFGDNGLGIAAHFSPDDFWYLSAAVKDAQSDVRETGFRTAFHGEDYFFYILETGIMPQFNSNNGALQGAYRIGVWYDPQPKANSDRANDGRYRRDDRGFYISCDQMLYKENADEQDSQGLGTFFRYGYAPSKTNDITQFVSFGFSYQGLFEGRDEDVLGVGFAHGTLSDSAKNTYNNDYESAVEVFYNAKITPYLNLSPSIQYITNPGGVDSVKDAVIFGLRAQLTF